MAGQNTTDRSEYFAFIGNVPPAGSTLKVVDVDEVCGTWIDYRALSAGIDWACGADGKVTIQAEDMELRGYQEEDDAKASGGEVIRLKLRRRDSALDRRRARPHDRADAKQQRRRHT